MPAAPDPSPDSAADDATRAAALRAEALDDRALVGRDPMRGLLDVEPIRGASSDPALVRLYVRDGEGRTQTREAPVHPFFFLSDRALLAGLDRARYHIQRLRGDAFFGHVVAFDTFGDYHEAMRHIERRVEARDKRPDEVYRVGSPAIQYLMQTGRTCFKGMDFADLRRLQLDIEVASDAGFPNAERRDDEVIIVALSDSSGWQRLLDARTLGSEEALLRATLATIAERDPDVIEAHNGYAFDLPYLDTRCALYGIPFALGRGGEVPRVFPAAMRFAERSVEYPAYEIAGRHVIDTMFQAMAYDVGKRDLPGYGLKAVARYFGFAPEGRTYVPGDEIARTWRTDPERLLAYALDDVTETERLSRHLSGASFYLTQMLPMPYGHAARTGPAAKIEALFVREYLRRRQSIPRPQWGSQSVGGYTDVFVTGIAGPIVYADVESLYPSIMLTHDVAPASDTLGLFPAFLRRLTDLRLATKRAARDAPTVDERSSLDARQAAYKVLINCFDAETEIVTVEGVKQVADVRVGDLVYALDPATLTAEIKPVEAVYAQPYAGEMVEVKTPHIDFLVTPEHRFLTSKHTSGAHQPFAWERAADFFSHRQRRRLPALVPLPALAPAPARVSLAEMCARLGIAHKTGPRGIKELRQQGRWQPESYALDDWLAFLGWYASEGTLYRSTPRVFPSGHVRGEGFRIMLCQKRADGREALAALLDRMGIAYAPDRNGFAFSSRVLFEVLEAECGRGSYEKRLPGWVFTLPPETLTVLFDALMAGDGHASGMRYTTASADLARDFQRLALHIGRRVVPAPSDGCHRFHVNAVRGLSPTFKPRHRQRVPHDGPVYCLTVADHHTVLAGRNGRFNWCGQSFYGNMGFGFAAFNDFAEADRVSATGQALLRAVIAEVRRRGGTVVEVDTDGILFEPPAGMEAEADERAFVEALNDVLPGGIRIAYEGRAAKMLSYKKKNYALMGYDGSLTFKGSSLVSRSTERFGRAFVRAAVERLLAEDVAGLHALYVGTRDRLLRREWPHGADDFSRTETLKDSVDAYLADVEAGRRTRAASYELAIARAAETGVPVRIGDRVTYYVTGAAPGVTTYDNSRWADAWRPDAPDENTAFYLKRLDEVARKFDVFFSDSDFRLVFSPPDLFGFDASAVRLVRTETLPDDGAEEVPF